MPPRPDWATSVAAASIQTRTIAARVTGVILLHAAEDEALQVIRLRYTRQDWMIAALHSFLDDRDERMAVDGGLVDHRAEHLFVDVVRATAGNEKSAGI